MGAPWVKKYSPEKIGDVIAQDSQMAVLKIFIENFKQQKKKAILIHGPSGCGKTSSVYAVGNELGMEMVEMNASDFRNKEQINSIVGAASQQMSLFGGSKLILIDELDGIAGRQDYGGIPALVKVIVDSKFPVIITANNPYNNKFSSIRNKSELLQFKELEAEDVFEILKRVCKKEKIKYDEDSLKMLARRAGGDARGAVNDLEIIATLGEGISKKAVDELSERNKTDTIINALLKIFKTKDPLIAVSAFDNVEEDFDQRMFWLDENLPKEYTNPKDLARAYDNLSRADVFKGRIRRWQHWRFLSYVSNLMTAGVAVSKDKKNKNFVQYKPTGRILKMWWAKQKNMKKKAIAAKIAEKTHTSSKQILKNIEYFKVIFQNNEEMAEKIADDLDLNQEEVDWLKK
ncbi:replication factor C large subunit [Candidatus Woesearchaeota archaeon]|nr:replication factor C large subunit [Candidatus Woesearchaeota archaeon]